MLQLRALLVVASLLGAGSAAAQPRASSTTTAPTPPIPTTAPTTTPQTCQVAVLDLEAQGLGADQQHITTVLTEALASSVAEHSGCEVITRADIESMMGFEAARMACGVDTDSCLAEIGNALGVQRVVAGSVASVGGAVTVSARLLNMERGKVDARAEETTRDAGAYRSIARSVGARLFGKDIALTSSSSGPGPLAIAGGVVGAIGVVGVVIGALTIPTAEANLGVRDRDGTLKEEDRFVGTLGLVVGGIGAAAVVGGVAMLLVDVLGE